MALKTHSFSRALAVCILSAAACGGGGAASVSDALDQDVHEECTKAFSCMSSYDATMHNGTTFSAEVDGATSEGDCETKLKALLGSDATAVQASVDAGRITFNSGDIDTCVSAEDAQSCDQFFSQNGKTQVDPPSCNTIFVGTVADGGTCTIGNDCSGSDSDCDTTTMKCVAQSAVVAHRRMFNQ